MKKKLIKRIEELSIENDRLRKELNNNCENGGYPKSTVKEMLFGENQSIPDSSQDFNEGDILIREWNDGTIDYCIFKEKETKDRFSITKFYTFQNDKIIKEFNIVYARYVVNPITQIKFDWRKATQSEIDKLNELLGVEVNNELEEAKECLKTYLKGDIITCDDMTKSVETILKHLNKN